MDFLAKPASSYPVAELVDLLNHGFEDYFIPIHFTSSLFLNMLHKDGIDLATSRVLLINQDPCGLALIAPRPTLHISRLAAMGIAKDTRGKGAGSWLMNILIAEARDRGDREMVLEVIEQNEPAMKLYRKYGFENIRRLVGYIHIGKKTEEKQKGILEEIELREMGTLISQYGLSDIPWQLSAEGVTQVNPPLHAYRDGQAYILMSDPKAEHVAIWSLLVEPEARGRGLGTRMLKQVLARWPGKTWHIPALCPEEFGHVFEKAGFEREKLSQWQMKVSL
jgi:ribosomal protein S18 acetylase RimI-like enzyme